VVRITPDVGRNRISIELSGRVTADDLPSAMSQLEEALSRVRAPVDVLSDVRALDSFDDDLEGTWRAVAVRLGNFGARKVVRVVGKSVQAAVQMERLGRRLKNHAAHLAFSLEEAEAVFRAS